MSSKTTSKIFITSKYIRNCVKQSPRWTTQD